MRTITIHCKHVAKDIHLRIAESNMCCIQCGLIQIVLSRAQAARVRSHCFCMEAALQYESKSDQGRATMTIDPSQLDLKGEFVASWLIG
jgi:hypothetical protein